MDLDHPGLPPPCFDEPSLICENDRPFVRTESLVRLPASANPPKAARRSADSEQWLTPNGSLVYHVTAACYTGVI
jgi:hypothetical protein